MLSIKDIDTFLNTFPIQKDEIVPFAAKAGGGGHVQAAGASFPSVVKIKAVKEMFGWV